MPEEVSIEDCVKYGVDAVLVLTFTGSFEGDLVSYISRELEVKYPSINGKADKIAKSLYWTFANRPDSLLESFFWVDIYNPSNSHHKYVRRIGNYDREGLILDIIKNYMLYILS